MLKSFSFLAGLLVCAIVASTVWAMSGDSGATSAGQFSSPAAEQSFAAKGDLSTAPSGDDLAKALAAGQDSGRLGKSDSCSMSCSTSCSMSCSMSCSTSCKPK